MIFLYLLILLAVVELITLIHEMGHFLVAKKNGVRVAEFSIGFGPAMFQIKRGTTAYSFRWLPFGGYVSVLSDDVVKELEKIREQNISPMQEKMIEKKTGGIKLNEDFSKQKTIDEIKTSRKVFFATAGVLFNFISIFVILLIGYAYIGKGFSTDQIFLKFYNENTDSVDNFYLFNSITQNNNDDFGGNDLGEISGYEDMSNFLRNPEDEEYNVNYYKVEENGSITPIEPGESGFAVLQIDVDIYNYDKDEFIETNNPLIDSNYVYFITFNESLSFHIGNYFVNGKNEDNGYLVLPYSFNEQGRATEFAVADFNNDYDYYIEYEQTTTLTGWPLLKYAFIDTFKAFWLSIVWLISFITLGFVNLGFHPTTNNLSQMAVFPALVMFFFKMTIIFSALMIIFNMLPIPPLDGWRTFEYGYEGTKKKKISKKTTSYAMWTGWGLILLLFILGIII